MSEQAQTPETRPAWEITEDGCAWPVTVVRRYKNMFGFWRVERSNGELGSVYGPNLKAADNLDIVFKWTP